MKTIEKVREIAEEMRMRIDELPLAAHVWIEELEAIEREAGEPVAWLAFDGKGWNPVRENIDGKCVPLYCSSSAAEANEVKRLNAEIERLERQYAELITLYCNA